MTGLWNTIACRGPFAQLMSTPREQVLTVQFFLAILSISGLTLAAGRAGHPIHERERVRASLVGRLADTLLGTTPLA